MQEESDNQRPGKPSTFPTKLMKAIPTGAAAGSNCSVAAAQKIGIAAGNNYRRAFLQLDTLAGRSRASRRMGGGAFGLSHSEDRACLYSQIRLVRRYS